mmetsp:Transcript_10496/g.38904  ORF Transcript_10496/g.38904 Transcript_10496/m.38904 type:complete len:313 (-) Transcript_10496:1963-2901(-)
MTSKENTWFGLSFMVYPIWSLNVNVLRSCVPAVASKNTPKWFVAPGSITFTHARSPIDDSDSTPHSSLSCSDSVTMEDPVLYRVVASEYATEPSLLVSMRTKTALAVPLVKAKYCVCLDPTATDPKFKLDGPALSWEISFGSNTLVQSLSCAAVTGAHGASVFGPPEPAEVSASTACCGRLRGRRYENGIFAALFRFDFDRRFPSSAACSQLVNTDLSIQSGSSAAGNAGPRSCFMDPNTPPTSFRGFKSYWFRNPNVVASFGSSCFLDICATRCFRESAMYSSYALLCCSFREAWSRVSACALGSGSARSL